MLELTRYSVRDTDAPAYLFPPRSFSPGCVRTHRRVLSDAVVHSRAGLGSAERRLRRPRYVNGSLQTARLRHHMTCSPFGSPSCGGSRRSPLASVLPDSRDEMCKSKTGNSFRTVRKRRRRGVVLLGVRSLVHGDVTPAVLTQTRFSISAGVFLFHFLFPAGTSDLEFIHVTPQHRRPVESRLMGRRPLVGKRDWESNQNSFYR